MALEVTHSLVEQFLPELAQPLRERCGDICNLDALNDHLTLFQDKLLPHEGGATSCGSDEETEEGGLLLPPPPLSLFSSSF